MSSLNSSASALIARFNLQPLPHEGGYFARTWTSRETLHNGRPAGTAIYFLLTPDGFSALHRLDADELWHFHAGDPVEHVQLSTRAHAHSSTHAGSSDSRLCTRLGANLTSGETPQLVVPAGTWQGARLATAASARHGWALVSCTMSPGWDDSGFELGSRETLATLFPSHEVTIFNLTRTT